MRHLFWLHVSTEFRQLLQLLKQKKIKMLQDALRKWQLFHEKKRNKHSSQNKLFFYYLNVMLFSKNRNGNVQENNNILFQILVLKINRENL